MDKVGIGIIGARFAADLHAHALGKMPLEVELVDAEGQRIHALSRS